LFINKRLVKDKEFQREVKLAYEMTVMSCNVTLDDYFCFLDIEFFERASLNSNVCVKKSEVALQDADKYAKYIGIVLGEALKKLENVRNLSNLKMHQKTLDNRIAGDSNFKDFWKDKYQLIQERHDPSQQKLDG
jgi:DNA mismatch repair ATPase MutL